MTNDIDKRLAMFGESKHINVKRIALTMEQVREYNPPPNPCKITDSRADSYMAEHGDESWELDALDPKVLEGLIRTEVEELIDDEAWKESEKKEAEQKAKLGKLSSNWETISKKL